MRSPAKQTCPRSSQHKKEHGSALQTHNARNCTSAQKAGTHCSGFLPASPMIGAAYSARNHCCTASQPQMREQMETSYIGIGGWIVTASNCAWFAEHSHASEIRAVWPQLSEAPQRYIACFETLAQLALAMTALCGLGAQQWTFCLPAASDNTVAEAQTEKLWSTAEPLGSFLKLTAAWAARHHIELLVTHLAGEHDAWADELSRGKLHRFQHRTSPSSSRNDSSNSSSGSNSGSSGSSSSSSSMRRRRRRKGGSGSRKEKTLRVYVFQISLNSARRLATSTANSRKVTMIR